MSDVMLFGVLRMPMPELEDLDLVTYVQIVGRMRQAADEIDSLRTQLAEARDAALEEAAEVSRRACLVPPDGGSPTDEEINVCVEACLQIRALKSQEKTGE